MSVVVKVKSVDQVNPVTAKGKDHNNRQNETPLTEQQRIATLILSQTVTSDSKWLEARHMMASVLTDELDATSVRAEVYSPYESECKTLLHKLASSNSKYTVIDQCIVIKKLVWCFENMPGYVEHIDDLGSNGLTALQNAVSCSNWTLALMLLQAGARMDLICDNTILHILVCDSISLGIQLPILEALVERGADLDQVDPQGHTAIHLAAWRHKWELVKALLEHGASATPKDPSQFTLFHRLATLSSHGSTFSKKKDTLEDVARILLSRGEDLNQLTEWNGVQVSPLHIAVEKENWLIVEMFLLWGADPNGVCIHGQGVLHRIAKSVNFKERGMMSLLMHLILLLQNKGVDIDALDCNGDSAVLLALAPGSFKPTTWFLLACGAQLQLNKLSDYMIRDFIGNLSLMPKNVLAGDKLKGIIQQMSGAYSASPDAMKFLLQTAFWDAVKFENYCIAWVLAECGANLNDIHCSHHVLHTMFRAGRVKRLTRDFEAFLVCMLSASHKNSLPFQLPYPLHFILKMTQQRLKRFLREGNPDVSDVASILRKLISRGADPLELVHSRSVLRALLEFCCSPSDSHWVFLPILRVLIEAGVSTHQPALTSLEPDCNHQQVSTHSPYPTVQYRCDAGGSCQTLSCHHFVNPVKVRKILKSPNLLYWTRDPEVVDILIRSGACSNKEVFRWREFLGSHQPSAEINSLMKVIDVHASTVPSLMSLARLVVSHSIGCGPQRQGFLEMESVPEILKSYVQFQDLFVEHVTHL